MRSRPINTYPHLIASWADAQELLEALLDRPGDETISESEINALIGHLLYIREQLFIGTGQASNG